MSIIAFFSIYYPITVNEKMPCIKTDKPQWIPVQRYSVDIFSYSGPSGILGSDG